MAASSTRDRCLTHGCGSESVRYCPKEAIQRVLLRVLFQAEQHTRDMRRLAVWSGRGRGVMFTSDKAILAAASATAFPLIPECEGTHCRVIPQPSDVMCRRLCWMAGTRAVDVVG